MQMLSINVEISGPSQYLSNVKKFIFGMHFQHHMYLPSDNIQGAHVATHYVPPCGRPSACAPPSRCNVAVLSHAEYVPTLTAAAALLVKAALSKAAL